MTLQIVEICLIAFLAILAEHLFPWGQIFKKALHPLVNYALGTLALNAAMSLLLIWMELWSVLLALWLVALCGGLADVLGYGIRHWLHTRTRAEIAEQEAAVLRQSDGGHDGQEG